MPNGKKIAKRAAVLLTIALALLAALLSGGPSASGMLQPTASAGLSATPATGTTVLIVDFVVNVGPPSSPACAPDAYSLDFGEGGIPATGSSSGPFLVTHTYFLTGTFIATLTFTREENVGTSGSPDCRQAQNSASVTITVLESKPLRFIGTDANWFNPSNWDEQRLPGPDDDVLIDGISTVVINLENAIGEPKPVEVRNLLLRDGASLETAAGTQLRFQELLSSSTGNTILRSSSFSGRRFEPSGILHLNPSIIDADDVVLDGSRSIFYLGGTFPVAADAVGLGHYGTLRGERISIVNNQLEVRLLFDFTPRAGDSFTIVEANDELTGTFLALADGAELTRFDNIGLFIQYNEKSIVLTAQAVQ